MPAVYNEAVADGVVAMQRSILENGGTSQAIMERSNELEPALGVDTDTLKQLPQWPQIIETLAIGDLLAGTVPKRIHLQGDPVPFNLQHDEELVWLFQDTRYFRMQVHRSYAGTSQGLSIRVARGIYYRPSVFHGQPVEHTQVDQLDQGFLGVTTKHLYFLGRSSGFRVSYGDIVSFLPLPDGFTIQRNGANAKPETFATGDGWFAYNLVANLSHLAQ